MQEAVTRRLEQLSFEARSDAGIRLMSPARPPGEPISDARPFMTALISLVMLPVSFALFLGFEAIAGSRVASTTKEDPPAEV